ncbi:uncharacterized protein K441DRAFT_739986 [Cenococcum geophilum 1.58]|uniref:Uncharacterized protein n=1 Tax=Cenococcum geophilum 1.58 TaxID=794803 RepID=A0ACC8ENV0_9PEZI|nr:hypothetical protein K441DRAFT_739986 [Cenococcum geophilum 1.58]
MTKACGGVAGDSSLQQRSRLQQTAMFRRRGWWIKASVSQTSHAQKMRSEQHRRRAEGTRESDQRRGEEGRRLRVAGVRKKDEGHTRRALAPREREGATGLVQVGGLEGQRGWGKDLFWKAHCRAVTGCKCSRKRLAGEEHGALAGVWA